ncbi:MAG: MFS transporter [Vampirovibrionales bacterium]|nr:MFS transporter [Vampirovibrionales bacterium]
MVSGGCRSAGGAPVLGVDTASPPLWTSSFIRLCACTVLLFGAYHALTPILPVFFAQRQMNGLQVGALLSAFLAASLLVRPFAGVLSDRVAPAWLMTMGLLGFAACAAAYPFAPGFWPLLAARLIQGASYALFYTGAAASLLSQSPPQRKAEALAWFGNAIKIAMAAAPALGLWMAGWRALAPFWLSALAALGALPLALKTPEIQRATAVRESGELSGSPWRLARLIEAGALFPGWMMAGNTLLFGAMMAYAPLLTSEKGLPSQGWFYAVFSIALIASRAVTSPWADRFGREIVALPGVTLTILSVAALALASNPLSFLAATACYGLSAGCVQPSLMALASDRAPACRQGAAMATFTLLNDFGIAAGSFLMPYWGEAIGYRSALLALCALAGLAWIALLASAVRAGALRARM